MKKGSASTVILILAFLVGLSLLLYPTLSDYWNSLRQNRTISEYTQQVAELDNDRYEQVWAAAREYNRALTEKANRYRITEEERAEYESLLNVSGSGVIGYIEIPRIKCSLPVYHGTDEAVLQIAIGHIEGSSLPVGGTGTHCVLSGHRGLPSAKLFTDLDQLVVGDEFLLRILDEVLTYEVDQILVVEPQQVEALSIDPERDYCTLVTCTPYGINTHRLLVRGHRVETREKEAVRVGADAVQIRPVEVAPVIAAPILLLLLLGLQIKTHRRK